jgi:uncharacterized membrane protein
MNGLLIKLADILGSSVCHQLPERSFNAGSLYMPVCARCEGIYLGFLFSALILFLMFRKREAELPPLYIIIILLLFVLSTVIDALLSYFFVIRTYNLSRLITGYLSGAAAMTIIFPIFNYQYFKRSKEIRIFSRPWKFILFLAISGTIIAIAASNIYIINNIFFYIIALGIVFTFYFANLIILFLIPYFSKKASRLFCRQLVIPSIIAVSLSAIELFISYKFHQLIIKMTA